ncbi:MAG TPA: gliding motility lipoprotein GldD [Prolixibacteraceae bacterium]|nr:gliding motility lipoprotein GldD [Prolixibacteraceae bacterium]
MRNLIVPLIISLVLLLSGSCSKTYTPKPRGYFHITFPEKAYQPFPDPAPFRFEYPLYARVIPDLSPNAEPWWMDLSIDQNKARIHLSYKAVDGNLDVLTEDSRDLAYKHTLKASSINEKFFANPEQKVYGILFEIKGNAASPFQFHLTDSLHHFIRGSLYIREIPNYDSLYPVITFLKEDLIHLVETFSWSDHAPDPE